MSQSMSVHKENSKAKGVKKSVQPQVISSESGNTDGYQILISTGQAEKISPKAGGTITWQLALSEADNQLYLRLLANGKGGLFSKDWISLPAVRDVLLVQPEEGFTSRVFKPLFKGASANNAGFLAAVLRSPEICLIEAHPEKVFTHVLYPDWLKRLEHLSSSEGSPVSA